MSKFLLFLGLIFLTFTVQAQDLNVSDLRCGYRVNPLGVDEVSPALSWKISSVKRNVTQTGYHILVADNPAALAKNIGNIWDTRKVSTDKSLQINYQGKVLIAGKKYYWKVKVYDNKGKVSAWSAPALWQMGLLKAADWKNARWIAYEKMADSLITILPLDTKKDKPTGNNILPLLRKDFQVAKAVKQATMYISGLGHFEFHLNGAKVGDNFLDAGWAKYDKEALYVTFDLTDQLKKGNNAIGVMLGNGFYYVPPVKGRYKKLRAAFGYPKMICRLHIEYKDGTEANVVSDQSWRTSPSPITFSSIYGGEDYDARLEQQGWNKSGFNAKGWTVPVLAGGPHLRAQKAEPLKIFNHFKAKSIKQVANAEWVYDMGQNASAIIELQVKGKKGDTIKLSPAELLKEDGSVTQKATGSPTYFLYILKGDGIEIWRPRFMYTGFRYVQLKGGVPEGQPNPGGQPVITELAGLHVRNSAAVVGEFSSSNELFNRSDELINWAIKSNMASVFTDCPHREKLGWLEELHLMGSSVRYNYDAATLFKKALQDMRNSQTPEGLVPEISPEYVKFEYGDGMFRDSPEWGSSSIIMPWYLYQWYGEEKALAENYPMMQRYLNYLATKAKNNILSQGLGDWYDLGPERPGVSQLTPMGVTGTAIYYYDLNIMEKIALKLGKTADAAKYRQLAIEVRKSFNDTFFHKETGQYATGSQAANAMAVYMKLVEPQYKAAVVENLIKDIRSRNNGLTAGDIGYRYVLRVLEEEGRSDVIYDMNSRSDVPGYGYQLAQGATALTESWAALPSVSNNHFMLGHLMEWFYSGVAGIRQAQESVAFKHIKIYPEPVGDLTSAKGSYLSPYGLITTDWKKTGDAFDLSIVVPPNTKATVYIPATNQQKITENGVSVQNNGVLTQDNNAVQLTGFEKGRAVLQIGSGTYSFKVQ